MRGAVVIWEVSVPYSQFCCKPNTTLKEKLFKISQSTVL